MKGSGADGVWDSSEGRGGGRRLKAVLGHVLETRRVWWVPGQALECGPRMWDLGKDQVESGGPRTTFLGPATKT